jgi:outer membrane receptor protein involved in Fe transport
MNTRWRGSLLAAAIAAASVCQLGAQSILTGDIAGRVLDPSGAGVPNVSLTATGEAFGDARTATTNSQGAYRFALLKPGAYVIKVSAKGFAEMQIRANSALGQVSTVDVNLSVASQSTLVEVTAETPILQNENANMAVSLNTAQLENLPVGGGDMVAYAYSAPGVTMSTGAGYGNFTSFGLPGTSNLFTVNGSDYMDPYLNLNNSGASNLSLGANEMQEVAIVTNGYTGQYGRQAGAQVNFVTKSGANAFHGNAMWGWNGTKLNANDFFNNSSDTDRPHAVSNQWATSVSGPIKKNKLFFFWDYEGLRYVLPSGGPVFIPTTDFANQVIKNLTATNPAAVPFYNQAFNLYNNSSGVARAVPVTQADDPTDLKAGSGLGCGDLTGSFGAYGITIPCARKFQASVNNLNTEWLSAEKVDWNATDKDHLYFRAWTDRGVQATATDPINSGFNANSNQPQWSTQLGYNRGISATQVNDLSLSGFYYSALFGPPNINAALAIFPTTWAFGDGLFSNMGGALSSYPQGRKVSQWQIIDDYSYIHGKHELKAGINLRRNDVGDYAFGPGTSGLVSFNSMTDFFNGSLVNGSTLAQTFTKIGAEHIGFYSLGLYAQDQWKVRPNLTVTLALRFDRFSNPNCARNCYARPNSTFEALAHDATQPYNAAIQTGIYEAFKNLDSIVTQPRLGVAYTTHTKTVIRGGIGLFGDQFQGNLNTRFFTNVPNVISFTGTSGVAVPGVAGSAYSALAASNAAFQSGFASGATVAQLKTAVPGFTLPNLNTQVDNFHIPRYAEWNIEVQQQITNNVTVSADYVGNHGWNEYNQNPWLNAYSTQGFGGLRTAPVDTRFGEILQLTSEGHSNYNGLTSSVRVRMHSFTGSLNYTWSHNLDTCSNNCLGRFNLGTAPSLRYQPSPAGVDTAYGNADYDIRHSLTANYLYNVPAPFDNKILKNTLGGWTVAGSFMAHSGYPYSVSNTLLRSTYIKNSSGAATIAMFPLFLNSPQAECGGPDTACLTRSQFLTTAQQLNTGFAGQLRNAFRGPGYFDTDFSVNKNIAIWERARFTIGANFYNVLNHPNFDNPVNSLSSGSFGQILGTVGPASSAYGAFQGSAVSGRIVVLHARFDF